jgi:hypothetical protein
MIIKSKFFLPNIYRPYRHWVNLNRRKNIFSLFPFLNTAVSGSIKNEAKTFAWNRSLGGVSISCRSVTPAVSSISDQVSRVIRRQYQCQEWINISMNHIWKHLTLWRVCVEKNILTQGGGGVYTELIIKPLSYRCNTLWELEYHFCNYRVESQDVRRWRVVVGKHHLLFPDLYEQTHTINRIIMHEGYDNVTVRNDIAILVLDNHVMYNSYVMPICLPEFSLSGILAHHGHSTTHGIVAGWGNTRGTCIY